MGFLRQHKEAGHLRAEAHVVGEPGTFSVRLTEGTPTSRLHEGLHFYASREIACTAADLLVRHRLRDHDCGTACSEWVEDDGIH
jgi:hypothetical protein